MSIAIDGPAGAGKSTVAKEVARKLNMVYIDTGAMYRALTLAGLNGEVSLEDGECLRALLDEMDLFLYCKDGAQRVSLNGEDITEKIRTQKVSQHVSKVARHRIVREKMVQLQQEMARRQEVVMDGRDIGTHVLPDAELKIFLTASIEERANRRFQELLARGENPNLKGLMEDIANRDRMDSERETAPLRQAPDAILLDTTGMTIEQVIDHIISLYKDKSGGRGA